MKNYWVFYSFKKEKESLLILFSNEEITYQKTIGKVIVSYHNIDVVSYQIKDINKIVKIHADGLIPLLNKEIISIINNVLIKDGLTPIIEKKHSGFYNAEVINASPLKVKTLDGEYLIDEEVNVDIHGHVVMVKEGSFLCNKEYVNKHHLCTFKELGISDSDTIFVDNDLDINEDFFMTSEG